MGSCSPRTVWGTSSAAGCRGPGGSCSTRTTTSRSWSRAANPTGSGTSCETLPPPQADDRPRPARSAQDQVRRGPRRLRGPRGSPPRPGKAASRVRRVGPSRPGSRGRVDDGGPAARDRPVARRGRSTPSGRPAWRRRRWSATSSRAAGTRSCCTTRRKISTRLPGRAPIPAGGPAHPIPGGSRPLPELRAGPEYLADIESAAAMLVPVAWFLHPANTRLEPLRDRFVTYPDACWTCGAGR